MPSSIEVTKKEEKSKGPKELEEVREEKILLKMIFIFSVIVLSLLEIYV